MRRHLALLTLIVAVMLAVPVPASAAIDTTLGDFRVTTFASPAQTMGGPLNAFDLAVDKSGNLYAGIDVVGGPCTVLKYSPSGQLLARWASSSLMAASEIAVDGSGNVYVADNQSHQLGKFSPTGQFLFKWSGEGRGDGQFGACEAMACDSAGNVYVSDIAYKHQCIQKFDPSGKFLFKWGTDGTGEGQFDFINGIAVDRNDDLYVTEADHARVQVFGSSGGFKRQFAVATAGSGNGSGARGITMDGYGDLWMWQGKPESYVFPAPEIAPVLLHYSSDGRLLSSLTVPKGALTEDPGGSWQPWAIASAADGTLYVLGSEDAILRFAPLPDPPATEAPQRISGSDRYQTAVEISKGAFASAQTVVLATGENFPDALSASGLCGAYKAPLLLTRRDVLPAAVISEMARLGAKQAFIVGGPTVVSDGVRADLERLGLTVERLSGPNRYDTSAAVARAVESKEGTAFSHIALVARGDAYPDALALSPLAYAGGMPILLARPSDMPAATRDVAASLGITSTVAAGGGNVLPDSVVSKLGVPFQRVSGASRYETARAVAEFGVAKGWVTAGFVGLATGENFPDALAGGAACGNKRGVILMTAGSSLNTAAEAFLTASKTSVKQAQVFGGANVVSAGVRIKLKQVLGW